MWIIRFLYRLIVGVVLLAALLLGYLWATEWRPEQAETLYEDTEALPIQLPETLTILSWNIGYAGLGDDMDFFYDGGKTTRTTSERTQCNLDSIAAFIARTEADFVLLQEIDFDSRRSYRTDQFEFLKQALSEYRGVAARNYVSPFVPMPLADPMGCVDAGLVTFSRYPITKAVRYQYPSEFSFPMRLFNLKRALLMTELTLSDGRTLYLNNTHNTAYDTGTMRAEELKHLALLLCGKSLSITAGDWNSNPPGYKAGERELNDPHFRPSSVRAEDFPMGFTFAADLSRPSNRYLYEPYRADSTATTILDFALCGPEVRVLDVRTVDLGFRNSDHNPVIFRVKIK